MIDDKMWKKLEPYANNNMYRIVKLLTGIYPNAITMEEIREKLKLSENAVYNALRHLKEKNKIEHKQPFWRFNELREKEC